MGFPESLILMIKNLYEDARCKILMNSIDVESFDIMSGCPQGCSLSGTNCLSTSVNIFALGGVYCVFFLVCLRQGGRMICI